MRYRFSRSLTVAVVAATIALPAAASAQLLFDTGAGTTSVLGGGFTGLGIGQGVAVTTATHLTQFGFYVLNSGGHFKFLIFDQANSTLLFSTIGSSLVSSGDATYTWLESGPLNLDLAAGKTYYFGLSANLENVFGLGLTSPAGTHSENGLALTGEPTFYTNYSTPTSTPILLTKSASVSLRLEGTQDATTTPEPSSMALLGTGLVGLVPMVRRRRR